MNTPPPRPVTAAASRTSSFIDPVGRRVPIGRAPGRLRPGHTSPPRPLRIRRSSSPLAITRSGVIDVFRPPLAHILYIIGSAEHLLYLYYYVLLLYYDGFRLTVFSNILYTSVVDRFPSRRPFTIPIPPPRRPDDALAGRYCEYLRK